jgi:hypothetical protein
MKNIPTVEESVFAASFFNTKLRPKEAVDPLSLRTSSLIRHTPSQEQGKQETAPRPPSILFSTQYAESLPRRSERVNVTGSYNPETQQWSSYSSIWNWAPWTVICEDDTWEEFECSVSTGNENLDGDCGTATDVEFDNMETED